MGVCACSPEEGGNPMISEMAAALGMDYHPVQCLRTECALAEQLKPPFYYMYRDIVMDDEMLNRLDRAIVNALRHQGLRSALDADADPTSP